jgi:uncharacterized protein YbbC (DUF1343 family)
MIPPETSRLDDAFPLVQTGLECCLKEPPEVLRGARLGLLFHQASVDAQLRDASELFATSFPHAPLSCLFSPQHGVWGEEQANMIETSHGNDARWGIPRYSLYSETRRPTPEMLRQIDCLVIDLQDVGTRVYTYAWTVVHCLQACAESRIPMVILDRPNPLGGTVAEGPRLHPDYASFVGMAPIPMRHGLTIAELARLCNELLGINCELHVVRMKGWQREMMFPETGLPWIPPSPNMPRFDTTVVYPGQVLLEGTNISEGRGTTLPFECLGAPFIDPYDLLNELDDPESHGVKLRPIYFRPTFDKWKGVRCGGLAWHWNRASLVRSYEMTIRILVGIWRRWPNEFAWLDPPYEYEYEKPPIDILSGSPTLRAIYSRHCGPPETEPAGTEAIDLSPVVSLDQRAWFEFAKPFLLY